jgi:hypothetical protein
LEVGSGFVASIARRGGNATGFTNLAAGITGNMVALYRLHYKLIAAGDNSSTGNIANYQYQLPKLPIGRRPTMPDQKIRKQYEAALKEDRAALAKLQKLTAQTSVRTPPNLLGQINKAKADWDAKRARRSALAAKLARS